MNRDSVPDRWHCVAERTAGEDSLCNVHMQAVSRARSKGSGCGLKIEHLGEISGFIRRDRLEGQNGDLICDPRCNWNPFEQNRQNRGCVIAPPDSRYHPSKRVDHSL